MEATMNNLRPSRALALAALVCSVALIPVASASASGASIKSAIKSYNSKILVAEGHVVSALGEYKQTKNPAGVQAALSESITVISALKSKVAHQSAGRPRVKKAKLKIEKGLEAIIVSYQKLATAYGEKTANPEAAIAEGTKALAAVKVGRKELLEGVKLLVA
jgi:hypothetical protein